MDLDNAALSIGQSPALIVVDAIKGFTDPNCALGHDCDRAMVHINRLIDAFHTRRAPVALTTVVYDDPSQASVFRRKLPALNLLERAEIWHEFDPRLHRKDTDLIIEKHWASAFHQTTLDAEFKQHGVDSIVVTGFTTSGCVRATAVDGLQNNYPVLVAQDACSDRNPAAHEANLFDLRAKYTDVVSTDEILGKLSVSNS